MAGATFMFSMYCYLGTHHLSSVAERLGRRISVQIALRTVRGMPNGQQGDL